MRGIFRVVLGLVVGLAALPSAVADVPTGLQEDLRAVASPLDEASKEATQYSGGLLRSLVLLRLEVLNTTKALLEQRALADTLETVNVDARVTESNKVFWRYAWRLTLRNHADVPARAEATIEFQDKDGFVIDEDREFNIPVPPKEEKTFTGSKLIQSAGAPNVARLSAKLRGH